LMLAEIDLLVVVAVGVEADIESEEATDGRCRDVDVNNTVTHLEVLKDRGAAVDEQAFAALIFCGLGIPLQIPAGRVRRNGERLPGLRSSCDTAKKNQSSGNEIALHLSPPSTSAER